jgi:hypothetical protein
VGNLPAETKVVGLVGWLVCWLVGSVSWVSQLHERFGSIPSSSKFQ